MYNLIMKDLKLPYRTFRQVRHVAIVWIIETIALILLDIWLPGLSIQTGGTAILAIGLIGLLNAILRPILLYLTLTITVLTFGLFSIVINIAIVLLVVQIIPGFLISNGQTAILVVIGITLINLLASQILSLDENDSYYRFVISRFNRKKITNPADGSKGMIIIQIDGLAKTILESALNQGVMPTLAKLYHDQLYHMEEWYSGLPSQTSACQLGIIYGKNEDIPAFRWYEKENHKLIVSNHLNDTAAIESKYKGSESLLGKKSSSIGNMFSGGAEKSAMTMSELPHVSQFSKRTGIFYNFFLNPYNFIRTFFLFFLEIFRDIYQRIAQIIKNQKPRIHLSLVFAIERALSTVFLRELTTHIIIEDMFNDFQTIYATYVGYDVVAHKTGIESTSTKSVLRGLDKQFQRIFKANELTNRRYSIIFLSDHGQSQGPTFRQTYGIALDELLKKFLTNDSPVLLAGASEEVKGSVNSLLQEALAPHRKFNQSAKNIYRQLSTEKGTYTYFDLPSKVTPTASDIVICPSGNMAMVYFPNFLERMSLEAISEVYPELIVNIVSHPGIGFVMLHSEEHGTVIIHANGINYLSKNTYEGKDILIKYSSEAINQLKKLDEYQHCGDLIIFSSYDPGNQETPAFEELIGHHGGLGGTQTQALIFFPKQLPWEKSISDSTQMNKVLQHWKKIILTSESVKQ